MSQGLRIPFYCHLRSQCDFVRSAVEVAKLRSFVTRDLVLHEGVALAFERLYEFALLSC